MEVVAVELTVDEEGRSAYEIERDKPMPSKNHGKLQARLGRGSFKLSEKIDYRTELANCLSEKYF